MEQELPRCIAGVQLLIQHLEMDAFAVELIHYLAEMERRPGQAVEPCDYQRILFRRYLPHPLVLNMIADDPTSP